MSKRATEQPHKPNSTLRVRVFEVELNGADSTIEEALKTVERMRRPVIEAPPMPKRIAQTIPAHENGNGASEEFAPNDEQTQFDFGGDETARVDPTCSSGEEPSPKKRGEGAARDRNAGIKPVGDVNFFPPGKQSLKEFFAEKSAATDLDQILVICHFLQNTLQMPSFGPGHILSGFKHVNKPIPKDLKQTIRNMRDKKAWVGFSDIEKINLTTEGENRVEHELGKDANEGA